MSGPVLEIRSNGALNCVQDLGRAGWLAQGVSLGGAMDRPALALANALAGNPAGSAAVEISQFPFRARLLADATLAWTGADSAVSLDGEAHPPWWSLAARAGQTLVIAPPRRGTRVYLACGGGIDVPQVLGARATDLKAGFGGVGGRGLQRGDTLAVTGAGDASARAFGLCPPERLRLFDELEQGVVTVAALAAAEYAAFTDQAREAFVQTHYTISSEANRTGYRLQGAALALSAPLELLSHGILPGTVQVPPDGQPIVQLADANTCGGYPRIATLIDSQLWRLAQAGPGMRLRFELLDADAALALLRSDALAHQRLLADIARWRQHL